jgi:hypothetical protein
MFIDRPSLLGKSHFWLYWFQFFVCLGLRVYDVIKYLSLINSGVDLVMVLEELKLLKR